MKKRTQLAVITMMAMSWITNAQSSGVFTDLEAAIKNPGKVHVLDLSHQELTSIPDTFQVFTGLREIRLVNNNLTKLPQSLSEVNSLRSVNLSGNVNLDVQQAIKVLGAIDDLKSLNLSACEIMFLPGSILRCDSLQSLALNSNQLLFLPASIGKLQKLEELNLADNYLFELPETFTRLQSLTKLHLENNKNLNIEWTIGQLSKMHISDVYFANQEVRGDLSNLYNIRRLELKECKFLKTPSLSGLLVEEFKFDNCTGYDVDSLILEVAKMDSIRQFSFKDENITSVNLKPLYGSGILSLRLQCENISDWNKTIYPLTRMEHLKELNLSANGISELPGNLNHFQSLSYLNLSDNNLDNSVLALRSQLEFLDIYSNEIDEEAIEALVENLPECKIQHDFMYAKPAAKQIPHPDFKPNFESFEWEGEEPKVVVLESGTTLNIPVGAFITKLGKPVSGPVKLMVEEYKTVEEIFASGIPMTYDSAGTTYNFRSGGMMEIRAFQNNEELKLGPGKVIDAKMVTSVNENFNVYNLNDTTGQWVKASGGAVPTSTVVRSMQNYTLLDSLSWYNVNNTWVMPSKEVVLFKVKRYPKLNSFVIQVENRKVSSKHQAAKIYPEAKYLSTEQWIYEGDNMERDFETMVSVVDSIRERYRYRRNDNSYPVHWTDVRRGPELLSDFYLMKNPNSDNFLLTLVFRGEVLEFPVAIHSSKTKPKVVQKQYKKFYSKYSDSYEDRAKKWQVVDSTFEADRVADLRQRWNSIKSVAVDSGGRMYIPRPALGYSIGGLGIVNCDIPLPIVPENPQLIVRAKFRKQDGKRIKEPTMTYVLDYTNNAAYRYRRGTPASIYKNSYSVIVVELGNGKNMGLVRFNQIKDALEKDNRKPEFQFEVYDNMEILMDSLGEQTVSLN